MELHPLTLFSAMFSPLQICGLIFCSKKLKKGREGSLQTIPADPKKIHTRLQPLRKPFRWNLTIGLPPVVLSLVSQDSTYRQSKIQAPYLSAVIFGRSILIQNSQQSLSHRRKAILMPQDSFQDTEEDSLYVVINQRYRSLFDFVDPQSCSINSFTQMTSCIVV